MTQNTDVTKLLNIGKSATAKAYQTILQKIAAGGTLTASELKTKKALESELEALQAKEQVKKDGKDKKHAIVPTKVICGIYGIFPSQLSLWESQDGAEIAKIAHNKWDATLFLKWWLEVKYNMIDPDDPQAQEYRTRWEKARAETLEVKLDILRGELKSKDEIHQQWAARMAIIINGLTIYQDRLPPLLEGKTKAQMRAIIKTENNRLRDWYCKEGE